MKAYAWQRAKQKSIHTRTYHFLYCCVYLSCARSSTLLVQHVNVYVRKYAPLAFWHPFRI